MSEIDINDPFLQNYSSAEYDKFLEDADKDNRLGDQDFLITEKIRDNWAPEFGGGPYVKLNGVLTSANNAKFNIMFSAPPSERELATVDAGRKRGIALSIKLLKELRENYGVTPTTINEGDTIRVKIDKDKEDKKTGKYYLRAVAIKPKAEIGQSNGTTASSGGVGF